MTPSFEVDAVLLDSDGVLVDSHEQVRVAWSAHAVELGLDIDGLLAEHAGVPARDTLTRFVPAAALDRAVARLEELEVATAASTVPIRGATALTALLPTGSWAIVTSASRRSGVARWRSAGVTVPPHVITADDVRRGKPDPQPYVAAAALLGIEPERCLVLENSPSGGVAGVASGAITVAVGDQPWGTRPAARIPDLGSIAVRVDARPGRRALVVTLIDTGPAATAR